MAKNEYELLLDQYYDAKRRNSKFIKVVEYKVKALLMGMHPQDPDYKSFVIPTNREEALEKIYHWLNLKS
jgi:hypothetical protein